MSRKKSTISSGEKLKAPCPTCKRVQNCVVLNGLIEKFESDNVFGRGNRRHLIIECLGCDTVFLGQEEQPIADGLASAMRIETYNPDQYSLWSYYPAPRWRELPNWFSLKFQVSYSGLSSLMRDTYDAANRSAFVLSAMGIRTCVDMAGEELGVSGIYSFAEKIEAMRKAGHISPREKAVLELLVDAGSAAAHRGWEPSREQLGLLLDTLETFIHHSIILPRDLDILSADVPKRS